MIFLYLIPFLLLFIPLPKFSRGKESFHEDYISPTQTLPIKGLFVLLVFFRHSSEYYDSGSVFDDLFFLVNARSGQLIVAIFLFYSGFGIYESFKKRGKDYFRSFPYRRLFKVWIHFAFAVSFFLIYSIAADINYPTRRILLSFTGWDDISNSNWFMFVSFLMYILAYIVFIIFHDASKTNGLILFTILSFAAIAVLFFFKPPYWYNTILCFTAGMWFSRYKTEIEDFFFKKGKYTLILFSLLFALIVCITLSTLFNIFVFVLIFIPIAIIFSLLIVMLTMKFKISNKALSFLGKHVFSIYMLQRLPLTILEGSIRNRYIYFVTCLSITIGISVVFDFLMGRLDHLLFERSGKNT